MNAARLVVCEKSGLWAAAWRSLLATPQVGLHETRYLAECWEELRQRPASFVAVEAHRDNAAEVLGWLFRLREAFPRASAVVLLSRELPASDFEFAFREAGAVQVACSPRQLEPVARLVRRHLAAIPRPERSLSEALWERLPWNEI